MTSKTFTTGTVIDSAWLNDVNTNTYTTVPALSTTVGTQSTAIAALQTAVTTSIGRNRLINGDFSVAQRPAFVTNALVYETCDRWWHLGGSGATIGITQNSLPTLGLFSKYGSFTLNSSLGKTFQYGQRIESINSADLAGQNVTVSGYIYDSNAVSSTTTLFLDYANSTDSFAGVTNISSTSLPTATSGWTRFSVTFTIPSAATTGLQVRFVTTLATTGTTVINLTGVQLEVGSTATAFEHRQYGIELVLCQRYFEQQTAPIQQYAATGNTITAMSTWAVPKRTTPTITVLTAPTYTNASGYTATAVGTNGFYGSLVITTTGVGIASSPIIYGSAEL